LSQVSLSQSSEHKWLLRLERNFTGILKGFQYAGVSIVVIMMLLTVVNSLGRYTHKFTVTGIIELSSFMLVMIIFLTIPAVQGKNGHVVVGLIVDRLSPRAQAIIDAITYTIGLSASILAAWQAAEEGFRMSQTGEVSLTLSIPFSPFYYVLAFGFAIFSLATVMLIIRFTYRAVKK
jgi:TRAP-type C4-dicarboxylate transport system permease small subunit